MGGIKLKVLFKILILFFLINSIYSQEVLIRWAYQPDKSTDFTVGIREGIVKLKNNQGINFYKLIVDSTRADFIIKLIHQNGKNRFQILPNENTKTSIYSAGKLDFFSAPLAPENIDLYKTEPITLKDSNLYFLITADGYHYAKLYIISQYLNNPIESSIKTSSDWIPAKITYSIPVTIDKLEKYELPYLDMETTLEGFVNLYSMELIEQLTDEKININVNQIKEIKSYSQTNRDTILWYNRGKVLKYFKMKRRYTYVDQKEGFMDIFLKNGDLKTTYLPDTTFFLFKYDNKVDTIYFSGFFWMEELGKSKYNYIWERTYNQRVDKKFLINLELK